LWRILKKIWNAFVSVLRFIKKHLWIILKEFLRAAAAVGWSIFIWGTAIKWSIFASIYWTPDLVAGWIILGILVFELLTRKIILEYI